MTKYYNKVVVNSETVIDLTNDTVTADKVLSGYIFHTSTGQQVTGIYEEFIERFGLTDSSGSNVVGSDNEVFMLLNNYKIDTLLLRDELDSHILEANEEINALRNKINDYETTESPLPIFVEDDILRDPNKQFILDSFKNPLDTTINYKQESIRLRDDILDYILQIADLTALSNHYQNRINELTILLNEKEEIE